MDNAVTVADFTTWLPWHAKWDRDEDGRITYLGPQEGSRDAGIIIAPADLWLSRGEVSVTIKLEPSAREAQARLLLGRDKDGAYITVGIGGYGVSYVLEAWEPEHNHQRPIELARSLLDEWPPDQRLSVTVQSRMLTMDVNGVPVISREIPYRLSRAHQLGLFAWGDARIVFEDLRIAREPAEAFVAIPFKGHDDIYEKVIKPIEKQLANPIRGDTKAGPGKITDQIETDIDDADLLIAEISALNPNVFYEAGYAVALGKPVIYLANEATELPFDVHAYRCVRYEATPDGLAVAAKKLAGEVKAALEQARTRQRPAKKRQRP